jgi:hypothetical protein
VSKRDAAHDSPWTRLEPGTNPYLEYYEASMSALPADVGRLFDPALDEDRRETLDAAVCDVLTADVLARYAWAVPDERALRVIGHFSPIIEIAAGNGYWAACLLDRGVDIVCADKMSGGKRAKGGGGGGAEPWTEVLRAGPELCKAHRERALLLVYPDDFDHSADSVALKCLESYAGSTVIHVGELFGSARLMEHPWGRSSGDDFQVRLNELYSKVLEVPLPTWPYSQDALTVWRRKHPCITDDGVFGHMPPDEQLRPAIACKALKHLL